MANMSYIRWENTYRDWLDCLESLNDYDRHETMYDPHSYRKNGGHEWSNKKYMIKSILRNANLLEIELNYMEEYEENYEEEE
jgi:hypothetical protein